MKDAPIYNKVLEYNMIRRAVEIERVNKIVIDENTKLRVEVSYLQEKVIQLNDELEQNNDDILAHFIGESIPVTEQTPLKINNKKCCIIL